MGLHREPGVIDMSPQLRNRLNVAVVQRHKVHPFEKLERRSIVIRLEGSSRTQSPSRQRIPGLIDFANGPPTTLFKG